MYIVQYTRYIQYIIKCILQVSYMIHVIHDTGNHQLIHAFIHTSYVRLYFVHGCIIGYCAYYFSYELPGFLSYSWIDINLPELRHVTDTKEQCVEQLACWGSLAVPKTAL